MPKNDQAKRFEEAAREAGCDDAAFERVFAAVVPPKRRAASDMPAATTKAKRAKK